MAITVSVGYSWVRASLDGQRMDGERVPEGETELPGSIVRVPGWEQYPWLRAGFSTRGGGRSSAYGAEGQNLGWTAEDDPAHVRRNRTRFVAAVGEGEAMSLVTVRQVHGSAVRDLEREPAPWMTPDGKALLEGDGLITLTPGRLLAILTADCVPVLIADTRTHAVGAFHAGWRGTLAGVVEQGVAAMRTRYGSRPEEIIAAIGPCIRACCFQVGEEVQSAFAPKFPYAAELFVSSGEPPSLHLDLVGANRRQLKCGGVAGDRITVLAECTACARLADGRRKFFSYRGEGGRTGRMLSAIAALR